MGSILRNEKHTHDLDKFLEDIEDDPNIYSINLLDSNLDIDFDLAQTLQVDEPDILPSLSPNASNNNLVCKTSDPIRHTRKRTNVVTTPPIVVPHPQKKMSVSWTQGKLSP